MRIENGQLFGFIQDSGMVKIEDLKEAFEEAQKDNKKLGEVLLQKKLISEIDLRKIYAYMLGIPFVDLSKEIIPQEVLQIIPEPIAKKYKIVAFEKNGRDLKIAMLNPEDIQTVDFIRKKTGLRIVACLSSADSIENILKYYEKSLKAEFGEIIGGSLTEVREDEDNADEGTEKDLKKMAQGLPIIQVVDTLIKHAILQSASDIHIEPEEKKVQVRYRIDGILHDAMVLPKETQPGIVARIKVLSNLKLDEHRVPQDGR